MGTGLAASASVAESRITDIERELRRLKETLAETRQAVRSGGVGGGGGSSGSGDVLRLAFTSGGVTASSGTTAGTGTVTLYDINPSTGALTAGNTATVMNGLLSAVPASKWLYVAIHRNSDGTECLVVPSVSCA
jgi:hypothetical protein